MDKNREVQVFERIESFTYKPRKISSKYYYMKTFNCTISSFFVPIFFFIGIFLFSTCNNPLTNDNKANIAFISFLSRINNFGTDIMEAGIGTGSGVPILVAPSSLTYTGSPYLFETGITITSIIPTVTGTVTSCQASPLLPAGLLLGMNCSISGVPNTRNGSATNYTITASNSAGSTTATISIWVRGWSISILAGSGMWADGTGAAASFNNPNGVAVDSNGTVYVADTNNNRIRKISPAGVVTSFVGNGTSSWKDGIGTDTSFSYPRGITIDTSGTLYVADNNRIRKISSSGVVNTLAGSWTMAYADGTGAAASFAYPNGLAVDSSGNVYVADTGNNRIRKIAPDGVVTTLAGNGTSAMVDGTGTAASFSFLNGIAIDTSGTIYVADSNIIRKINSSGVVTTFAGGGATGITDGIGTAASFNNPNGLAIDLSGTIYVADTNNQRIRTMTSSNLVSTLAGGAGVWVDGTGTAASFYNPDGITIDSSGNLFVADVNNNRIRKVTSSGVVTTFAGNGSSGFVDGTGTAASFSYPRGITIDSSGNLFVADNNRIRKINSSGVVTTLAGGSVWGWVDGTGLEAGFSYINGIAVDSSSGNIFVTDNNRIRKITSSGVVSTFAGNATIASIDGTGVDASFYYPGAIALDSSGNIFVADSGRIRKITSSGVVTTFAGGGTNGVMDGTGTAASFSYPRGIAIDSSGIIYVADSSRIRKITPDAVVTTLGRNLFFTGTESINPSGLVIDSSGTILFTDSNNHRIKQMIYQ